MSNRDLIQQDKLHTTSLILILIDMYTAEVLDWDLQTIKIELEDDLNIKVPDSVMTKIAVGIQLVKTDKFYVSLPDFINFCNVLADDPTLEQSWSPADASEVAWAVVEAGLIGPPEYETEKKFSDEIIAYIIVILREAGVSTPPDSLKFIPSDSLIGPSLGAFSDEPTLFNAAYSEAQEASDALNAAVEEESYQLLEELDQLDLRHGDVKPFTKQLLENLSPPTRLLV